MNERCDKEREKGVRGVTCIRRKVVILAVDEDLLLVASGLQ